MRLLVLALVAALASPLAAQPADADAIRAVIAQTEAANTAGDVDAWLALFTDDAVYMPPGAPAVTTREGLRAVAEAGFRHDADVRIVPDEIVVAGDWAFARSRVTGEVVLADTGETVAIDVKQLVVYQRDADGVWRIARLIGNANGT